MIRDCRRSGARNCRSSTRHNISKSAKLVKVADKICNLRDILESPPKDWLVERQQEYFEWAKRVIDPMRGVNPKLKRRFDQLYRKRPR